MITDLIRMFVYLSIRIICLDDVLLRDALFFHDELHSISTFVLCIRFDVTSSVNIKAMTHHAFCPLSFQSLSIGFPEEVASISLTPKQNVLQGYSFISTRCPLSIVDCGS